ncbi:hypothetical protein [Enterobacter hormaechei]|uniref:hypothetical protein n=1 Tax=Enterobacter hormaechei TaxID=158836 RepID=UPI0012B88E68|nr:hypothetical protein [Enterobacter hormaechei]
MKTQMQIVQEAIARLEQMSRGEFVDSLVSSGLAEKELAKHEVFSRVIFMDDTVEVVGRTTSLDRADVFAASGKELSFAF